MPDNMPMMGDDDTEDDSFMPEIERENGRTSPETLNRSVLCLIILGALMDNIGSAALINICQAPLAFNHWFSDFVEVGESPPLSLDGFRWMNVCLALVVIPSLSFRHASFRKLE